MDYDLKRIPRFPDPIEEEEREEKSKSDLLYNNILRLHNLLTIKYKLLSDEDKRKYIKNLRETYGTLFNKLKLKNHQIEKIENFILKGKTHILIGKLNNKDIKL